MKYYHKSKTIKDTKFIDDDDALASVIHFSINVIVIC